MIATVKERVEKQIKTVEVEKTVGGTLTLELNTDEANTLFVILGSPDALCRAADWDYLVPVARKAIDIDRVRPVCQIIRKALSGQITNFSEG